MEGARSLTYAVKNTIVSPTLLLRSHSSPYPNLCECGSSVHEELYVNVLPDTLFTTKPGKLVATINQIVENISKQKTGSCDYIHYTCNRMSKITSYVSQDEQFWWSNLFSIEGEETASLTPFILTLRALIHFEDFYGNNKANNLTEIIRICRSCDHTKRPDYKTSRLKFYIGLSSYLNCIDMFCWSPGSRDIAFAFVLAWCDLLMHENRLQQVASNLAPQSFGVIENWAEYLSTGRLSSKASRFIQVEPDDPSLFQEPDFSNISANHMHLTAREIVVAKNPETEFTEYNLNSNTRHKSITLIIDVGDSCTVEEKLLNANSGLQKLSKVWKSTVAKQLENMNNTIVYKIGEPLDSVVKSINKFWGNNRCNACLEKLL
ncbi:hypothetical protein MN116_008403 [Schistosoma mekongi]|uniref:Uncharacterized protein n=1 Tax=Schistosoma mekongi TaxID=38744 RepID=A0AAE1Z7H0_SCHME|nr:hypothetical protein MN116_008403 [Schistosoma mekongi]